jgi:hypothetical protein
LSGAAAGAGSESGGIAMSEPVVGSTATAIANVVLVLE